VRATAEKKGGKGFGLLRARHLRFTREGKYFVALTLGIGFAAINTGNNLLYLLLGMMLAFIIGSGILSEVSLRSVEVVRRIPDRLFAKRPFLTAIGLKNTKRRLPSFSIEVEDLLADRPLEKKCYFLKVPAGRTQHTSYRHTFARRGLYRFSGFKVSTRFPFAFFQKSGRVEEPCEAVVFPEVRPLAPPARFGATPGEREAGRIERRGEFHGLRELRVGDDRRDIHWRKSAATGRMLVTEREEEKGRRVAIFLDNRRPELVSPADLDRIEDAVSEAASLAVHYVRLGYTVLLATRTVSVGPGEGQPFLTRALRALALLDFVETDVPYVAPASWSGGCVFVRPQGLTAPPPPRAADPAPAARRGAGA
jgi:uncharacterized protein (DUF58 family)